MVAAPTISWQYWPPNTSVKLTNVLWDSSYRDIVKFDSQSQVDSYMESLDGYEFTNARMVKFNQPVILPVPFNEASKYNYMVVYNDYPDFDSPRKWYYFVQSVEYSSAKATIFHIMLDVWTSFQFDVTFGNCFVERGHIGVANSNAMNDYGLDYLDIPEGLDTGSQGVIVNECAADFIDRNQCGIFVTSTTQLETDPGTEDNPRLQTAQGSSVNGVVNGTSAYYLPTLNDARNLFAAGSSYPWVTQGISSIWMCPQLDVSSMTKVPLFGQSGGSVAMYNIGTTDINSYLASSDKTALNVDSFRNVFQSALPSEFRKFTKFLTYPYCWIELTMENGTSVVYKPQFINSASLAVKELFWAGAPSPRAAFYVAAYNSQVPNNPTVFGENLNSAIHVADWPRLVIVNNNAVLYLASNAHSIAWQYKSASWEQQKTMMGANNAYAQSQLSTGYNSQQTAMSNRNRSALNSITASQLDQSNAIAAQQQATDYAINQVRTGVSGVSGVIGAGASGSAAGVLSGVLSTGTNIVTNDIANNQTTATRNANIANSLTTNAARTAQSNSYASASTGLSNQETMQFADMNRSLATATASGDYANTIAGINAKVQDANLNEPSVSGASGGDAFLFALNRWEVFVRFKMCSPSAMRTIGAFWERYGYYVQRFLKPPASLQCMSRFTYWKMHELYLSSATCPEEFRLTIKGIFEKGVTVWGDPNDIGTVSYSDNDILPGISY